MAELKNKKKVLVLADFLFPEYIGGSARLAAELNEQLDASGFDITCICRKPKGVYASKLSFKRSYRIVYCDQLFAIFRVLFMEKWDFVLAHHFSLGLFSLLLKPKYFSGYFFHGPVQLERMARGGGSVGAVIRRWMEEIALSRADRVFCLSDFMSEQVPKFLKKKITITGPLHNKIVPSDIKNKAVNFSFLKCLTVRRLTPRTGVLELAETLAQLPTQIELTVVGSGELLDVLQGRNYPNIKIVGQIDDHGLNELYQTSDLVVLPSRELEGFGLIIIEALLNGTPVIASDKAGGGTQFLKQFSEDFVYSLSSDPEQTLSAFKRAIYAYNNENTRANFIESISHATMKSFVDLVFDTSTSNAAGISK